MVFAFGLFFDLDAVFRGVLSTRVALAIGFDSVVVGLEPGGRLNPSPRLAILVNLFMAKSIKVNQKKRRGRPATGRDPVSAVRLPKDLTSAVDRWAVTHEINRSEAIRQLVELGLTVKTKARSTGRRPPAALVADLAAETIDSLPPKPIAKRGRLARAQELARDAIENMVDPTVPPEERDQRRRRLTKGPPEFRAARVDQPKAKGK